MTKRVDFKVGNCFARVRNTTHAIEPHRDEARGACSRDITREAVTNVPDVARICVEFFENLLEGKWIRFCDPNLTRDSHSIEALFETDASKLPSLQIRRPVGNKRQTKVVVIGKVKDVLDVIEEHIGVAIESLVQLQGRLKYRPIRAATRAQRSSPNLAANRSEVDET